MAVTSQLTVVLAEPRGFCAGVDRAIAIVERALERFGAPVYVRHEIVHNRRVVEQLRRKGAVFVPEVADVPDGATVIFSAHGVSRAVVQEAERRPLRVLDATCPLVEKVHREAERLDRDGVHVVLIGHRGHPEVEGTIGQLPPGRISLVSSMEDIGTLAQERPAGAVGYITQTTLSIDETAAMRERLQQLFPGLRPPPREDICYATQNRQNAVKQLAQSCPLILVLGAPNSSNSNRLREVAERQGAVAYLIESVADLHLAWFAGVARVGVTAGASAPEVLIDELLEFFRCHFADLAVKTLTVDRESLFFALPRELRDAPTGTTRESRPDAPATLSR